MMTHTSRFLFRLMVLAIGAVLIVSGAVPALTQAGHEVVILVIDDFTGEAPDVSDLDAGDSCAVSFEEQAFAVRGAAAEETDATTHGDLVLALLEELLAEAGAEESIALVPVEMHGLTADAVAAAILDAMDANPADVYIANMSFALIPCDTVAAYTELQAALNEAREAGDSSQYRSLLRRAVIFYDDTVFPVMSQRAQDLVNLNPLQDLFVEQGSLILPVAAAGNYGLAFPFWPGAWAQVVSVSASTGDGYYPASAWVKQDDSPLLGAVAGQRGQNTRISNYGEVMLPGEYESEVGPVSGTSFAAPRLSAALALYARSVGQDHCRTEGGNPALAHGGWDNLTLAEVAEEHCPALEAYLPAE